MGYDAEAGTLVEGAKTHSTIVRVSALNLSLNIFVHLLRANSVWMYGSVPRSGSDLFNNVMSRSLPLLGTDPYTDV